MIKEKQSADDFRAALETIGAETVHIGLPDVEAELRHKSVSAEKAVKLARNGYAFCEVVHYWTIDEKQFVETAFPDRPATLRADTLRKYPFEDRAAFCIADFTGDFGAKSPRNLLLSQLAEAGRLGYTVQSAFEFEFNLFDETRAEMKANGYRNPRHFAPENRTYSLQTAAVHAELIDGLRKTMTTLDVPLDAIHSEMGPGFFEAPLSYAAGVRAADNAVLFKNFARAYFARKGLVAGFMAKVSQALPGNSGHMHLSLRDRDGRPAFADPDDPQGISKTCRHFIGGVNRLMPELLLMCSHTVNAYKRLVPGTWAPVMPSWGVQNRTAALRVINDSPEATRVEFRVPSADSNPYTTLAMCLAAGLYGIREKIDPGPAAEGSVYDLPYVAQKALPRDLGEAVERFAASKAARALFGPEFVTMYAAIRRKEFQDYCDYLREITPWEIERYLGIV